MESIRLNDNLKQVLVIGLIALLLLAGGIKPVYAEADSESNQTIMVEY